jgi:hypothetical protein
LPRLPSVIPSLHSGQALSGAKDLLLGRAQILRCAQDDSSAYALAGFTPSGGYC